MMTDTVLKRKGLDVLSDAFGLVDAERFISLFLREPFDYTEWRENLYGDMSLDEFCDRVKKFKKRKQPSTKPPPPVGARSEYATASPR
jgi:hypothetical protein